ncbi:unnamed protein product [Parnassius mnemosyne]|uniref:Nose resistant-to-fluoxetine protein N-terminal domain-containing protein n=1 Tax=Parnassius mnemosyne TaxID=213953 RepID=A0AAV1L3D7_9NEOP
MLVINKRILLSLLLYNLTSCVITDIVKCTETENIITEISPVSTVYKKPTSYIDLLIDDLLDQEWDESENSCYDQTLTILTNVKNSTLWATWIWDSNQFPTGQFYGAQNHLGNFDQCLRREWSNDDSIFTQYCLVDITLADKEVDKKITDLNPYDRAEKYFHIKTDYNLRFNILSWGVCMPKVCQAKSVDRFTRTLLKISHLGTINPNPKVMVGSCQATQTPPTNSKGLYLLMLGIALLAVIACAFTYITTKYRESKSNRIAMKIVSAFDLNSNAADLVSTGKDEIKVMHGVRFLTACIVVFLHVMFIYIMAKVGNGLDMNDDFIRHAGYLSHTSVLVDTYFMMSGLLLMKSFKPETGRSISPFKILLKRYFRLIWFFIVTIIISITASPYLYGGPLWFKYAKVEQDVCKKNWWLGLLMLGNYIDSSNICNEVSWYVPADFHLAAVSTIMYWLYQKNRRGGQYFFGLVTIVSLILPGLNTYLNQLSAITVFDFETIGNNRKYILGSPMYVQSHLRAVPYFIGLIAGYILSVYKPTSYRNLLSLKYSILSFITIMALSATILVMGPAYRFREYNVIESSFFAALNRPIWASLMAAFILLCEYGTLPHITDFLSWSAFVPLSKLSYGVYMCHFFLVMRLTLDLRSPAWHDLYKILQDSMGIVVISYLLSLFMALFIESPLNNLVAFVLKTKPPKPKQINTDKSDTGTLNSDSLKKNGINKVATVEETGFESMKNEFIKDNAALHLSGVDNSVYSAKQFEVSNKNRVESQNCTTEEKVWKKKF